MPSGRWSRLLYRWRFALFGAIDAISWVVALTFATLARLDFDGSQVREDFPNVLLVGLAAGLVQLLVGFAVGLYRGRRPIGSFGEVKLVALTTATTTALMFIVVAVISPRLVPLSALLAAGAFQLIGSLGVRYIGRSITEAATRSGHEREHRTLVFGAGNAGEIVTRELLNDRGTDLEPVAFLDDDPTKRRLIIDGLRVAGTRDDIASAAKSLGADTLLIAIPSASRDTIAEISVIAQGAGLTVKIMPSFDAIVRLGLNMGEIRDVAMADFLYRDEVNIDDAAIRRYVEGRRILVTGAGGSIGSVMCRRLRDFGPSAVTMVDHDENALQRLQLSLEGRALLDDPNLVLCDVRDPDALDAVFVAQQPQVVFHAAAHKHVSFLERFPAEAVKTNVEGTHNVLDAAQRHGVERFVNISTDKAADPTSVLGATKRIAERVTAFFNSGSKGIYLSVRFGNVLGSAGSVIPTFVEQIRNGYPVTVTDPEATRYFMTTDEAVLLVLQSGAVGRGGDVLVLDMGDPVRIADLPAHLSAEIHPGSPPPEIIFTGLRPGEKLHETVASKDDQELDHPHEHIRRFNVPPLDVETAMLDLDTDRGLREALLVVAASDSSWGVAARSTDE